MITLFPPEVPVSEKQRTVTLSDAQSDVFLTALAPNLEALQQLSATLASLIVLTGDDPARLVKLAVDEETKAVQLTYVAD